jgi:uncharacterized RDD family membrane protein YckC
MTRPFIGIDFGTCNSSAAWFNPRTGQAESLLNAEGDNKTPSVVYFGPKNEIVIGRYAEDRLEDPDERKRVLSAAKRNLTKKIARVVDGRSITPLEAAALVLGKLKYDAEVLHFHQPVTRAVITCPAVFDEVERDQVRDAAKRAGFLDVALLEEPVAAAEAYTKNGISVGRHVLVYDLGGGTFDLAWLAREDGEVEFRLAMEPRGKRIGGEDFDRAIYDYFEAEVYKKSEQPICPDGLDLDLLRRCRRLKESLSVSEQPAPVTWRGHGMKLTLRLSRARFEELVEKHVELTVRLTQSIQGDAAAAGYPLESVILIGGASRTPCIIKRLHETLEVEPRRWEKQDVAVALGAAYHAQRLWGQESRPKRDPTQRANGAASGKKKAHEEDRQRQQSATPEAVRKQKVLLEVDEPDPPGKAKEVAANGAGERVFCTSCGKMIAASANHCHFCGKAVSAAPLPTPGKTSSGEPPLASRWSRLGAAVIDLLATFVLGFIAGIFMVASEALGAIVLVVGGLTLAGFQIYLLTTRGQSIGKIVLGIRIIKQDGGSPGFVRAALLRWIVPGLIGAIPYLGLIVSLVDVLFIFGPEQRCLHDLIAGTIVVKGAARK